MLPLLAALAVFAGAAPAPAAPSGDAAGPRPDVLLIVIDTCRRDGLGCYGNPRDNTPELDRFAAANVRFERAIATAPWTLPSVASVLTSRLPSVHGAYRAANDDYTGLRAGIVSGVEILRERGYRTHAIVNAAFLNPTFRLDRGFDVYDFAPANAEVLRRAGECVDLALEVLEEGRDRPDFLLLHVFDPHMPYDPPGRFRRLWTEDYRGSWSPPLKLHKAMMQPGWMPSPENLRFTRLTYEAEIAYVSEQFGRFFDELQRRALWEDTLILLTSDHGEEFHEHGGWEHGHSYHDEVIRVPLLVKVPAGTPVARQVVETQVSLLDVMPTIFEAIGEEAPAEFAGESLLPLVSDPAEPRDRIAVSERNRREGQQASLRDDRYVLIQDLGTGAVRLYDRREDPGELEDLAAARPAEAARLREQLRAALEQAERESGEAGERELVAPEEQLREQLESLGYTGN